MADRASYFLLVTILVLVTVLLVFAMKYFSSARQAQAQIQARVAGDTAYRELAERAVRTQEELTASLASIRSSVTQIEGRLASVEKILKDVG